MKLFIRIISRLRVFKMHLTSSKCTFTDIGTHMLTTGSVLLPILVLTCWQQEMYFYRYWSSHVNNRKCTFTDIGTCMLTTGSVLLPILVLTRWQQEVYFYRYWYLHVEKKDWQLHFILRLLNMRYPALMWSCLPSG